MRTKRRGLGGCLTMFMTLTDFWNMYMGWEGEWVEVDPPFSKQTLQRVEWQMVQWKAVSE